MEKTEDFVATQILIGSHYINAFPTPKWPWDLKNMFCSNETDKYFSFLNDEN